MPVKSSPLAVRLLHLSRITALKYPAFMTILPLFHVLVTIFYFYEYLCHCTGIDRKSRGLEKRKVKSKIEIEI